MEGKLFFFTANSFFDQIQVFHHGNLFLVKFCFFQQEISICHLKVVFFESKRKIGIEIDFLTANRFSGCMALYVPCLTHSSNMECVRRGIPSLVGCPACMLFLCAPPSGCMVLYVPRLTYSTNVDPNYYKSLVGACCFYVPRPPGAWCYMCPAPHI